jgi:MarR family
MNGRRARPPRLDRSKSGLTRVIDRMEQAGLVRRFRPDNDRRSIFVLQTPDGRQAMERARPLIHAWIEQNFSRPLTDTDIKASPARSRNSALTPEPTAQAATSPDAAPRDTNTVPLASTRRAGPSARWGAELRPRRSELCRRNPEWPAGLERAP